MLLSRVAESLFWLGRYVERAENTARLLDVTYHGRLAPSAHEVAGATNTWEAMIRTLGLGHGYDAAYSRNDEDSTIEFLTVHRDNPSSIITSLMRARENARSARDCLSSESWLAINRLYHDVANTNLQLILADGLYDFCDSVRLGANLFSGTVDATSLRDEGLQWLWAGVYLERADMLTRLVDSKYHLLMSSLEEVGGALDRFQWVAVLKSVSAWEAYLRLRPGGVDPAGVIEFLLLNDRFPRSLRTSVDDLLRALEAATTGASPRLRNPSMRLVTDLQSRLRFETGTTLINAGLHEFLLDLQGVLAAITQAVSESFFWAAAGAA